jgi:GT2 family glycosyltransferase/trans-aconitate methyltransferase
MIEELNQKIIGNDYESAAKVIEAYNKEAFDVTDCILAATAYEMLHMDAKTIEFIEKGLSMDPTNYELYLMLGNYYAVSNPDQAFLCYENAEYYCGKECGRDSDDYSIIHEAKTCLCEQSQLSVHPASIVILSYNTLEVTKLCIKSIRSQCNPDAYELIVIDNASADGSAEWLAGQPDIKLIANSENAGFPAGCNQGIEAAAPENDIFLLNSDTVVMQNSLFNLRMGLYASATIGAAGCVTNYARNDQMVDEKFATPSDSVAYACKRNVPDHAALEFKAWLVGFAMLIKRSVLDCVGELDTLYTPGNYEDNDICIRISKAGYRMVLCHNSFIFHWGSKSFDSLGKQNYSNILGVNYKKFIEKWGFRPNYYSIARKELLELVQNDRTAALNVLDVGCGAGATLARIKYLYPNANVYGVELLPEIADMADESLHVISGDIECMELPYQTGYFDYIICADVLDELTDPEAVLKKLKPYLKPDGCILASIPNLMNAQTIYTLLHGDFHYAKRETRDITRLRYFTQNDIVRLFTNAGFPTMKLVGMFHQLYTTEKYKTFFEQLLSIEGVSDKQSFDIYQYEIKAPNC